MSAVLQTAALLVTALGLVAGLVTLLRLRDVRLALGVLLDFLVGAGLLRLADDVTVLGLVTVVLVIAVRKLVMRALQADQRVPAAAGG
ncbi:hypothetical protein GCM10023328_11160 [Modestobacter marinus]|uniref:DUF1622 domain-containing protein n=1 Tax=Modestobacter marinus TaxID=477641 RepID=A0A846LQ85_9ACTN|nr:hypothetical protein [Modestobacter marinus]NIH70043.1 hypothetical protein [Modestobacter marinus]GGL81781.1 hypothetical protein GCM10011589_42690 [Modestobacter marinus]